MYKAAGVPSRLSLLPRVLVALSLPAQIPNMAVFSLASWAVVATLLATAFCAAPPLFPLVPRNNNNSLSSCLHPLEASPKTAALLVDNYAQLIGNYSDALADAYLADNFSDTSASINALAGIDLSAVTFPSKAAFMASQETQPKIPLVVSTINAVTRDTIVLRWIQTFGEANEPVAGISILTFVCQGGEWKLSKLYAEFNSLVYFEDIGGSCSL